MRFIITGSGGCVATPKPCCRCRICKQAREKGYPYARTGPSLYLEDSSLLVDTPEDIAHSLNNADIKSVDHILYSHWDPDHTLGMRVLEQLRLEWLDFYDGVKPQSSVTVHASPSVMEDINGIRSKYGSLMDYYVSMGLAARHIIDGPFDIGGVTVTTIPVPKNKSVSVFVFESGGKKLVYAPCDCKPFPEDTVLHNADVLVIGNTVVGEILKDGRILGPNHPILDELHTMDDVLRIKKALAAEHVIVTHLEEDWGKNYDDYTTLEKEYNGVRFAFDGMEIDV